MRPHALTLRKTPVNKTFLIVLLITLSILVASPKVLVLRPDGQWHIVCIKANSVNCISWLINSEHLESYQSSFVNKKHGQYRCGIGNHEEVRFSEEAPVDVKSVCKNISMISYEDFVGLAISRELKQHRIRRQTRPRRGRYRGQTQSQYLAIDKGNGKDDGKAEAHSDADTSRAIVIGSSGMGQAQSQTIYDPTCDECINKPDDLNAESLRRPPSDQRFKTDQKIIPGNQGNSPPAYGPNQGNYNIIPNGNVDKQSPPNNGISNGQSGTTNPNMDGNYGQDRKNGLPWYQPGGTVGGPGGSNTPNANGISNNQHSMRPDQGSNYDINRYQPNNQGPGKDWRQNVGPNQGFSSDGQQGYRPQIVGTGSENPIYATNGGYHNGGPGGPAAQGNQWPGGYNPDYRQGIAETNRPGTIPGMRYDQTVPGRFETYGPNDTSPAMGGLQPGSTGGSDRRGVPQSTHPVSEFGERPYGPNQNTFGPIPSNSPLGNTGFLPSQKYPAGWPFITGSYPGPNGEVYYCCVVSSNGQSARGYIPNANTGNLWPGPYGNSEGRYPDGSVPRPNAGTDGQWPGPGSQSTGPGSTPGGTVPGTPWFGPGTQDGGGRGSANIPGENGPGAQWYGPGPYSGGRGDGSKSSGNVSGNKWPGPGSSDVGRGYGTMPGGNIPGAQWPGPYDVGRGGANKPTGNVPSAQWPGPGTYDGRRDGSVPGATGPGFNTGGTSNQWPGSKNDGGSSGSNLPGVQWPGSGTYGNGRGDGSFPGGAVPGTNVEGNGNQWHGPRGDGSTAGGNVPGSQWSGPGRYGGGNMPGGTLPGTNVGGNDNQWQGPRGNVNIPGGNVPGAQWSGPGQYGVGRGDGYIPGGTSPGTNVGASDNQWQGPRRDGTSGSIPGAQWSGPGQYGSGKGDGNTPNGVVPGANNGFTDNQWQGPRGDGSTTGGNIPGTQWSGPKQYGGGKGDGNIPAGAVPGGSVGSNGDQWQGPRGDGTYPGGNVPGPYGGGKGGNMPGGDISGGQWSGPGSDSGGRGGNMPGGNVPSGQWSGQGPSAGGSDGNMPGKNVPGGQWSGSGPFSNGREGNTPGGYVPGGQWPGYGSYGGNRDSNTPGGISGSNYDQGIVNKPGGVPQNVIDPNSILHSNDDSAAEASISQTSNGTVVSAIANGGNEKGRAQTKVQGTHTGSGSFSAQADISDDNKGAHSEVEGGEKGSKSSAQGRGVSNLSQAAVQLGSETGSIQTTAESKGGLHSSNSQVQGSIKGGMADAQATGPGSTSSQAQIGFSPHKEGDMTHDIMTSPFVGKGLASAKSSGRSGQSQSSLQGTFKYGISYNGAAQAGASLDKDAVFSNRQPFVGIDVFDEKNKNINISSINKYPTTENKYQTNTELYEKNETTHNSDTMNHTHADHHKYDKTNTLYSTSSPVDSRRSFDGEFKYSTEKELNTADDYYPDGGFGPESNDMEQPEYPSYDEYNRDGNDFTHEAIQKGVNKKLEVKQTTGNNAQHIVLDSLEGQDAEITQRDTDRPDESRIYQPGERVPGTGGYIIPIGFTGSVKSVASRNKTYAVGSRDSPSQAQTVALSPGTGKIKYVYPPTAKVAPDKLRSLSNPKTVNNNGYVSVSKSVAHDLDSDNNIRKQYSHTYYTKSSSCGYFTFSCTMVSSPSGKKKVCKPKLPTNPDGTPMKC